MLNILCAIKTLSPMHCGIGTGMNDIDLPVARSKVSGHPLIPGSTIKGVIKDEFRSNWNDEREALFGADNPDGHDGKAFASAVSMGDAILLALPVRSFHGTFAYLASPYTLQQFKSVLSRTLPGATCPDIPLDLGLREANDNYRVMLSTDSLLKGPNDNLVLFEELDLLVDERNADDWAEAIASHFFDAEEERMLFKKRFAVADDNALNFLCETALPVDARIALDDRTGTVKQGALWYEETVPAESLFFSLVGVDRSFKKGVDKSAGELANLLVPQGTKNEIFAQMGGKSTTGKGFVSVRFIKEA